MEMPWENTKLIAVALLNLVEFISIKIPYTRNELHRYTQVQSQRLWGTACGMTDQ